ncbi:MAG: hypothetical protein JNL32_08140 [Candidatus Kapabacteria bacterium]|nr:hypothetical protein [Candidatus Kapabacteria bacterium]
MPVRTVPEGGHAIALSTGYVYLSNNSKAPPALPLSVQYAYGINDGLSLTASLTKSIGVGLAARICHKNGVVPELTIATEPGYQLGVVSENKPFTLRSSATASWDINTSAYIYSGMRHDHLPGYWSMLFPTIGLQSLGNISIQIELRTAGYDFWDTTTPSISRPSFIIPNGGIIGFVFAW